MAAGIGASARTVSRSGSRPSRRILPTHKGPPCRRAFVHFMAAASSLPPRSDASRRTASRSTAHSQPLSYARLGVDCAGPTGCPPWTLSRSGHDDDSTSRRNSLLLNGAPPSARGRSPLHAAWPPSSARATRTHGCVCSAQRFIPTRLARTRMWIWPSRGRLARLSAVVEPGRRAGTGIRNRPRGHRHYVRQPAGAH